MCDTELILPSQDTPRESLQLDPLEQDSIFFHYQDEPQHSFQDPAFHLLVPGLLNPLQTATEMTSVTLFYFITRRDIRTEKLRQEEKEGGEKADRLVDLLHHS